MQYTYWVNATAHDGVIVRREFNSERDARAWIDSLSDYYRHAQITTNNGNTLVANIPL